MYPEPLFEVNRKNNTGDITFVFSQDSETLIFTVSIILLWQCLLYQGESG